MWLELLVAVTLGGAASEVGATPELQRPWVEPSGQGLALGLDVVGAPNAVEWDASVTVPLGALFALRARPTLYRGLHALGGWSVGARVEALVRSRPMLGLLRVYAGCGPALFYGLSGPGAHSLDFNGDWLAGVEVFLRPGASLHIELGTSGGAFETGGGFHTGVGLVLYPF